MTARRPITEQPPRRYWIAVSVPAAEVDDDLSDALASAADRAETVLQEEHGYEATVWRSAVPNRAEVLAEAKAETAAWLTKKAREFRANGETVQADTASLLASKVQRGAVRPDNLRMLPADFFETGRTYTYQANGFTAPELIVLFRPEHITRHPEHGHRRAIGWSKTGEPGAKWHGDFYDEFDGWTEVTKDGDA